MRRAGFVSSGVEKAVGALSQEWRVTGWAGHVLESGQQINTIWGSELGHSHQATPTFRVPGEKEASAKGAERM